MMVFSSDIGNMGEKISSIVTTSNKTMFNSLFEPLLVLTSRGDILFANKAFCSLFEINSIGHLALGDLFKCSGCNYAVNCVIDGPCTRDCAMYSAIFNAYNGNSENYECQIKPKDGKKLYLPSRMTPLSINGERTVVMVLPVTTVKRDPGSYQQDFLNFILNASCSIQTCVSLLNGTDASKIENITKMIRSASEQMTVAVKARQMALLAEQDNLSLQYSDFYSNDLLGEISHFCMTYYISKGRYLNVSIDNSFVISSDWNVLYYVLIGLMKKMIDISDKKGKVYLSASHDDTDVIFTIKSSMGKQKDSTEPLSTGMFETQPVEALILVEKLLKGKLSFTVKENSFHIILSVPNQYQYAISGSTY